MKPLRVICGCEASGVVREAFRELGHDAWSCDIRPAEDESPYHLQCDVLTVMNDGFDLGVFHPDCTYLTNSAEWAYKDADFERYPGVGYHQWVKPGTLTGVARRAARDAAVAFVKAIWGADIPGLVIENPAGCLTTRFMPPSQYIHPYQFNDDASKKTGLWIRGLPLLVPTTRYPGRLVEWPVGSGKIVERWGNQTDGGQNKLTPSDDRWVLRSRTYDGIAKAMALQLTTRRGLFH